MGTQVITLGSGAGGVFQHLPFGESLTPFMKNGIKV
jgi:hypothetical protein